MDRHIEEKAEALAEAMRFLPTLETLAARKKVLESDGEARNLLAHYERFQAELVRKQEAGEWNLEDVEEMRRLQSRLHSCSSFVAFRDACQEAVELSRDVVEDLSLHLGINFRGYMSPPEE